MLRSASNALSAASALLVSATSPLTAAGSFHAPASLAAGAGAVAKRSTMESSARPGRALRVFAALASASIARTSAGASSFFSVTAFHSKSSSRAVPACPMSSIQGPLPSRGMPLFTMEAESDLLTISAGIFARPQASWRWRSSVSAFHSPLASAVIQASARSLIESHAA